MNQQEFWNSKFSRDGFLYGLKPNYEQPQNLNSFL